MWNFNRINHFDPINNPGGTRVFSTLGFNPDSTSVDKNMATTTDLRLLGPILNGLKLSQVTSDKKFVNPNFVNKQNPKSQPCQGTKSDTTFGSNLVESCAKFLVGQTKLGEIKKFTDDYDKFETGKESENISGIKLDVGSNLGESCEKIQCKCQNSTTVDECDCIYSKNASPKEKINIDLNKTEILEKSESRKSEPIEIPSQTRRSSTAYFLDFDMCKKPSTSPSPKKTKNLKKMGSRNSHQKSKDQRDEMLDLMELQRALRHYEEATNQHIQDPLVPRKALATSTPILDSDFKPEQLERLRSIRRDLILREKNHRSGNRHAPMLSRSYEEPRTPPPSPRSFLSLSPDYSGLRRSSEHVSPMEYLLYKHYGPWDEDVTLKDSRRDVIHPKYHKHSKVDRLLMRKCPKKQSKHPWNGFRKERPDHKDFDYSDLDYEQDYYDNYDPCEEEEEDDLPIKTIKDKDQSWLPTTEGFKVLQSEKLHIHRDDEDIKFVVGPFFDKEGAMSFMDSGKHPQQPIETKTISVGEEVSLSDPPTTGELCAKLIKRFACKRVTARVVDCDKRHHYTVNFHPSQPCEDEESCTCTNCSPCGQRTCSECSDDFIVFQDDGNGTEDVESCCTDDSSEISDFDSSNGCCDLSGSFDGYKEGCTCGGHEPEPDMPETCCGGEGEYRSCKKKVTFNDANLTTVHPMVKWNYAYRAARKGQWEVYARDRDRFKHRISQQAKEINPILDPSHRCKIYQTRFSTD